LACAANLPCEEDVDAPLPLSPADLDNAVLCRAAFLDLTTLGLAASLLDAALDADLDLAAALAVLEAAPLFPLEEDDRLAAALTLGLAASRLLAADALDLALAADLALLEAAPLFAREVDLLVDEDLVLPVDVLPLGGIIKFLRPLLEALLL